MQDISKVEYDNLKKLLSEKDIKDFHEKTPHLPDEKELRDAIANTLSVDKFSERTVVGIDIYRYGLYEPLEQSLIPFIFRAIYEEAKNSCIGKDQYIFQLYQEASFQKYFINTGDGGFQIFPTPIHSIVFLIHFEIIVRAYNSFHLYPKLRKIVGPLSLRYAITLDKIFCFDNNFFGPSIINNARILSRDSLNRCLIDENTVQWFMFNINGIEMLQYIAIVDIKNIHAFESYKEIKEQIYGQGVLPTHKNLSSIPSKIPKVDLLKIGEIPVKGSKITVYNLHIQIHCKIEDEKETKKASEFVVTLGNLNTSGIT